MGVSGVREQVVHDILEAVRAAEICVREPLDALLGQREGLEVVPHGLVEGLRVPQRAAEREDEGTTLAPEQAALRLKVNAVGGEYGFLALGANTAFALLERAPLRPKSHLHGISGAECPVQELYDAKVVVAVPRLLRRAVGPRQQRHHVARQARVLVRGGHRLVVHVHAGEDGLARRMPRDGPLLPQEHKHSGSLPFQNFRVVGRDEVEESRAVGAGVDLALLGVHPALALEAPLFDLGMVVPVAVNDDLRLGEARVPDVVVPNFARLPELGSRQNDRELPGAQVREHAFLALPLPRPFSFGGLSFPDLGQLLVLHGPQPLLLFPGLFLPLQSLPLVSRLAVVGPLGLQLLERSDPPYQFRPARRVGQVCLPQPELLVLLVQQAGVFGRLLRRREGDELQDGDARLGQAVVDLVAQNLHVLRGDEIPSSQRGRGLLQESVHHLLVPPVTVCDLATDLLEEGQRALVRHAADHADVDLLIRVAPLRLLREVEVHARLRPPQQGLHEERGRVQVAEGLPEVLPDDPDDDVDLSGHPPHLVALLLVLVHLDVVHQEGLQLQVRAPVPRKGVLQRLPVLFVLRGVHREDLEHGPRLLFIVVRPLVDVLRHAGLRGRGASRPP